MKMNHKAWWLFFCSMCWVFLFFLQKTNLAGSDLGRHIKNGEIIVTTGKVFSENLYSYTQPHFYVPNHHWLFGVIAYTVHAISGFSGLTIMSAVLFTAAVAVGWWYAARRSNDVAATIATLIAIPLFADRSETRPEAFSLFFFAVLWVLIGNWIENKSKNVRWQQYLLPAILMVAWVNIHIFFILAIPLLGAAFVQTLGSHNKVLKWSILSLAIVMLLSTLINPFGLTLTVYPFQIFANYGYRVAENQPLWFFLQHYTQNHHWYLLFYLIISSAAFMYLWLQKRRYSLYLSVLFVFFAAFTARLIRMENVLALVSLPLLGEAGALIWQQWQKSIKNLLLQPLSLMGVSIGGFGVAVLLISSGEFLPFNYGLGVGLYPRYDQTLTFIKQLPVTTPIFNNFDVGSLLIYALYPSQKVFIDNRAEAYPADFLQNSYVQAQKDEVVWEKMDQEHHFGAIIFYRQENTNWGQEFLVKRIQDTSWVPIYVDDYLIIFLKNVPENQALIEQYRLPPEMFSISQN